MKFWPEINLNNMSTSIHVLWFQKNLWVSKKLVGIKFCRFPEFHGFEDQIGSPTYLAMFPS